MTGLASGGGACHVAPWVGSGSRDPGEQALAELDVMGYPTDLLSIDADAVLPEDGGEVGPVVRLHVQLGVTAVRFVGPNHRASLCREVVD